MSYRERQHTHQQLGQLVRVVGVLDEVRGRDGTWVDQLGGDEDGGGGHQLELALPDVELAEEPVHDVAGQQEHVGMAVLVEAHLNNSKGQLKRLSLGRKRQFSTLMYDGGKKVNRVEEN